MDNNKSTNKTKRPLDWKLTIDDLMSEMKEGKRKGIGQDELDWAREYQISIIPESYRFPRQGDLYESILDQEIDFMTSWSAPFTGSGQGTLLKGERIWIPEEVEEKSTGAYAVPVDYSILEQRMIPEMDRKADKYGGFYFIVRTVDLYEKYKLVETDFKKERYK